MTIINAPETEATRVNYREPGELIIRTRGMSKQFNGQRAVENIDLEIPPGKIFGFIGPSGCGKTTTVRLLTGVYEPTAGEVVVFGRRPTKFNRRTRERIGYLPQISVLYSDLSVWENLNFAASVYGVDLRRKDRLDELLEFVELKEHKSKLVRNLSGGMQRRLSLAAALVHDPELLFLDEPTAGIDPVLRRKFWDHFNELQDQGRTLFITTQYVGEAAYCDYVGVMAEGRLLLVDTPEGLQRRAFGGEVVHLRTRERVSYSDVQRLQELGFVKGRITRFNETGLRLVVEEASIAMPELIEWCKVNGIAVEAIEEYIPPYDDAFVELVKHETENK
jgi:ABC-2 type transport system ATP-binding protein